MCYYSFCLYVCLFLQFPDCEKNMEACFFLKEKDSTILIKQYLFDTSGTHLLEKQIWQSVLKCIVSFTKYTWMKDSFQLQAFHLCHHALRNNMTHQRVYGIRQPLIKLWESVEKYCGQCMWKVKAWRLLWCVVYHNKCRPDHFPIFDSLPLALHLEDIRLLSLS